MADNGAACCPTKPRLQQAQHARGTSGVQDIATHKPHPHTEEQDEEPGHLPVEPDNGPVPPAIPPDEEHDRVQDPPI